MNIINYTVKVTTSLSILTDKYKRIDLYLNLERKCTYIMLNI